MCLECSNERLNNQAHLAFTHILFGLCKHKGVAFQEWMRNAGAATAGMLALSGVSDSVGAANSPTTSWVLDDGPDDASASDASSNEATYLSFGTPVGGLPPL